MATKIKKTYCTMFKRTASEKRQAEMSVELEETKKELAELRELFNELKAEQSGKVVSSGKGTKGTKSTK